MIADCGNKRNHPVRPRSLGGRGAGGKTGAAYATQYHATQRRLNAGSSSRFRRIEKKGATPLFARHKGQHRRLGWRK